MDTRSPNRLLTPDAIADELTSLLRTPAGTMRLRALQAKCLLAGEAATGRLFTNAAVGLGKSLMLALLMRLCGGARPLILTEANIVPQMAQEFERYRLHFTDIPTAYRLESYETLSNRPELLLEYKPTWLGLDEAQHVKRPADSTRGKRVERWREQHPHVPVAIVTATPGEAFKEYAHLLIWAVPALGAGLIPLDDTGRPAGAAFNALCKRLKEDDQFHAEFWRRVRATPGVVISSETYTEKPLIVHHEILSTPPAMLEHWTRLRTLGEAPDGWYLEGPAESWGVARCLAAGFYYEHIPRPPEPFRAARRAWAGFVQTVIDAGEQMRGGPYDTEGQVARGVLAGNLPRGVYDEWMRMLPTYNPVTRTAWLSTAMLEWAEQWGRQNGPLSGRTSGGSIIWTEHTGFGEELSRRTGWPYYSDGAKNAQRQHVRNATAPVIICSVDSCGTGKNLQYRYSRNAFVNPMTNHRQTEQTHGRTHRLGQPEPAVHATYVYACLEDWAGARKAETRATGAQKDLTTPPKILMAQHHRCSYPGDSDPGPAWEKAGSAVVVVPDEE